MAHDRDELPTGKVRRATSTTAALGPSGARLAGSLLTSLARSPERGREVLEARHEEIADHAVAVLGNLRGGAMKIGQLASFVDVDFLPSEYRAIYQEKFAELRDAAPAMSWEKVKRVLEREWQEPVESLFAEFDGEAVAAASIGQVHRGVLADGRRVAVKVQYPEIADALKSDLDLASVLIRLGKAIAPGLDPRAVAGELRERVLEELDFELEAQQQRFGFSEGHMTLIQCAQESGHPRRADLDHTTHQLGETLQDLVIDQCGQEVLRRMGDGMEILAAQVLAAPQPIRYLRVASVVIGGVQTTATADVQHQRDAVGLQHLPDRIVIEMRG